MDMQIKIRWSYLHSQKQSTHCTNLLEFHAENLTVFTRLTPFSVDIPVQRSPMKDAVLHDRARITEWRHTRPNR